MSLARLLQLASPALPVGAFSYSQGLEWAVEDGSVCGEADAAAWIGALLRHGVARFEAPLMAAQLAAWSRHDHAEAARLNGEFLASRETAELRAETLQMGYSLRRLLGDVQALEVEAAAALASLDECAFPTAWSCAAACWAIPRPDAVGAYLWGWLENQVMAAVKLVPLGQTAGQRLLLQLGGELEALAETALDLPEAQWCNFTPGLAIASSRHESQYSRLFRS